MGPSERQGLAGAPAAELASRAALGRQLALLHLHREFVERPIAAWLQSRLGLLKPG